MLYTQEILAQKTEHNHYVWIENENLVLIARYGAFVLNFNQEPQHRTQQSMCNSLFSLKSGLQFQPTPLFYVAQKFKLLLRCLLILLHMMSITKERFHKSLTIINCRCVTCMS